MESGLTLTEIKHELTCEDYFEMDEAFAKRKRIASGRPLRMDVTAEGEKNYFRNLLMKARGKGKPKKRSSRIIKAGRLRRK